MQNNPFDAARPTLGETLLSSLSASEKSLHDHALDLSRRHRALEAELVAVLAEIDEAEFFRKLGWSSLFSYAVSALGLSEAMAYAFITVTRKTKQVADLGAAIESRQISVAKASRLTGILTRENAQQLIEFAVTHTTRETDNEVARLRELVEASGLGSDSACAVRARRHKLEISGAVLDLIKRAEACAASRERKPVDLDRVLLLALNDYLDRVDPVRKAERAQERTQKRKQLRSQSNAQERRESEECTKNSAQTELPAKSHLEQTSEQCSEPRALKHGTLRSAPTTTRPAPMTKSVSRSARAEAPAEARASASAAESVPTTGSLSARKPLTAQQKHAVFSRDGGRCTFRDLNGNRCPHQIWLHLHHIHPVCLGGGNDSSNLTTLCAFHHELVHQLSFPLDGQISWVRERQATYR